MTEDDYFFFFFFLSVGREEKDRKHAGDLRTGGIGIGDGGHFQKQGIALFLSVRGFEYPVIVTRAVPPVLYPI